MTATVSILVAQREHVLKIPKTALRFQPRLTLKEREQFVAAFQQHQAMHVPGSTGATPTPGLAKHPEGLDPDPRRNSCHPLQYVSASTMISSVSCKTVIYRKARS